MKYILDGRSKKAHIMLLSRGSAGILNKKESVEKFLQSLGTYQMRMYRREAKFRGFNFNFNFCNILAPDDPVYLPQASTLSHNVVVEITSIKL